MTKEVLTINVSRFNTNDIAKQLNDALANKNLTVNGIFFNASSLLKGTIEILVESQQTFAVTKPSKFKQNASSKYYCVYKKGNGWTYKFVNRKISKKPFLGKMFDDEMDAALAYDKHRFSVEGDLSKLNFPEHYVEVK